jgi:molybdopterin/thiamine biosynthesis adenylyltransferase
MKSNVEQNSVNYGLNKNNIFNPSIIEHSYNLNSESNEKYLKYEKYENQIKLNNYDINFQNKLKECSVLVIGLGGIGSAALNHLCCTGFYNIGILDYDKISVSNLHRQYIYTENSVSKNKTEIAKEYCIQRNKDINIIIHNKHIGKFFSELDVLYVSLVLLRRYIYYCKYYI